MSLADETYQRVCVLREAHEGPHLPFRDAPAKDEFGNKHVEHPRCIHVVPVSTETADRYRVVFEIIDPRMPGAGWHEVVRETSDLADAQQQYEGLIQLEAEGDDARNPRIERAVVTWEPL